MSKLYKFTPTCASLSAINLQRYNYLRASTGINYTNLLRRAQALELLGSLQGSRASPYQTARIGTPKYPCEHGYSDIPLLTLWHVSCLTYIIPHRKRNFNVGVKYYYPFFTFFCGIFLLSLRSIPGSLPRLRITYIFRPRIPYSLLRLHILS